MSYTKLDGTIEPDIGPDVGIQPDTDVPNITEVPPIPEGTSQSGSGQQGSSFFNFANFVNPQAYIDPILKDNDVEVRERQFSGGNTLDESVWTTLHRDVSSINDKLLSILWPLRLSNKLKVLRRIPGFAPDEEQTQGVSAEDYSKETIRRILDWDLWGPLVINLSFSVIITYLQTRTLNANSDVDAKSSEIFSGAFTLIWAALAVLSVNVQLLTPVKQETEAGGTTSGVIGLSFFQCLSTLSYTMFPVMLGGLISLFVPLRPVRLVINTIMLLWSLLCSWLILAIVNNCKTPATSSGFLYDTVTDADEGTDGDRRIFLMVYPIALVFGLFSWFCVIV